MPDMSDTAGHAPARKGEALVPANPGHGAPRTGRKAKPFHGKGMWYRILGRIHQLSTAEDDQSKPDDGPVSKVQY
jgi:hypothetical protein